MLDVERRFDLDSEELERHLLENSRTLHPDHVGSEPAARYRAILAMAALNEAYGVLKDPWRRAEYLLELLGGPRAADDKQVPDGFLEEMMELRMSADEARLEGPGGPLSELLESLEQRLAEQEKALPARFAGVEREGDEAARQRGLRTLRLGLNMAAYLRGLRRDLHGSSHP